VIAILNNLHDVARQRHAKVSNRHFNQKRQKSRFDFAAKRRREIVLHGRLAGASDNHLIAWLWNNPKAIEAYQKMDLKFDPTWLLQNAAWSMRRKISDAEAAEIFDRAMSAIDFKRRSADSLAIFLNLTWDVRQALRITTIGSTNVRKDDRKEIRKTRDKVRKEWKRRANGVQPRDEYLLKNSLSRTKPWEMEGLPRSTWYRQRRQQAIRFRSRFDAASVVVVETTPSAAISKLAVDTLVSRSLGGCQ